MIDSNNNTNVNIKNYIKYLICLEQRKLLQIKKEKLIKK